MSEVETTAGRSSPIGATVENGGVNFCLYSKHATGVDLLLFDKADDARPAQTITLDLASNKTYHYWHVFVPGIGAGQLYGYKVSGPDEPSTGLRFDTTKLLVDPYALATANTENYDRARAATAGENMAVAIKSVVVDPADYDWEGDEPLNRPFVDEAIYELHVAGFTRNPNSGVAAKKRGTFAGLIEKIPYLVELGIKTVELMPVQQFDPQASPTGTNYWGYQPLAWFAPHQDYSSQPGVLAAVTEFRDLVKALHRANIEVILDVVFNHTAEGNTSGPTLSLRGIDNPTYYILDSANPASYVDDTGCGNTVSGNKSVVRRMILDCLRHWVEHMHVDGFRFDLAASLSRGEDGEPLAHPPILLDIEVDPVLAGTTIIAEAWDAAGLYQLAHFGTDRWAVWNGAFRDHVRRFLKGDTGTVDKLADNLVASANLFHEPDRLPNRSVNFITAHDGFTLNDLVSYEEKHNEANGEQNRDGSNDNFSWNCGVEGITDDATIEALRQRQIKNFLTILLMSEGRPMLAMGDEVRRTQQGNNNAYCQDNEISWFDWDDVDRHADIRRFAAGLLQFHQNLVIFRDHIYWGHNGNSMIRWHGVRLRQPDWGEDSHAIAYELTHDETGDHVHVILNAYWKPLNFDLPPTAAGCEWRRVVDTAIESPQDFCAPPAVLPNGQSQYACQPRSSVVLVSVTV
ncbi:glycogen debranching protein GlgX [Symmachiella dynata]|uniref:glycogen debranching protein GlgX n=1 Tax=Symmachiella dynata TaxID=2527995 RepID=UPI0030EBC9BB